MDKEIQSLRAREVQATIDDLNQYLEGNVTAVGLVDSLQDMIKFLNQFIFENKTDNFDLRKYLSEGKLLKENMYIDDEDKLNEVYMGENLSKILKLRSDLQNANDSLSFLVKNDPDFGWQKFSDTTNSMLRAINNLI